IGLPQSARANRHMFRSPFMLSSRRTSAQSSNQLHYQANNIKMPRIRLTVSRTTPCIFTDRVPPKIRKMIFSHLLVKDKPFKFTHIWTTDEEGNRERQRVTYPNTRNSRYHGMEYDANLRTWSRTQPRLAALLYTCKAFYGEAAEVLYGCNEFEFVTTAIATHVLDSFGSSKRFIKTLAIRHHNKSTMEGFWKTMAPLTDLRSLTMDHDGLCQTDPNHSQPKLSVLIDHMKPLLKGLKESYSTRGLTANPIDAFVLEPKPCVSCSCTCGERRKRGEYRDCDEAWDVQTSAAGHAELVASLRALMRKALAEVDT
ncbi:hypothetical protein LTR95_010934, partial [Oleoguttula sp. CCFEE 5521]